MSHRGKRGKKPHHRAREARRASFDLYLPRLLRGDITPAEAALLAEYIREEMRVSDETHANLVATSRALDRNREATDTAVQEAEQRAEEAEARAATLESRPQYVIAFDGSAPPVPAREAEADTATMVLHTVARPAPAPGVDEMRRHALADALDVAPGTPWPTLLQHAREAHQWARRSRANAEEAGQLKVEMARNTEARESLGRRMVEAQEQVREATAAALRLRSQTPGAALRTLDAIRSAHTIGEVCTHVGIFYGMKPETAGQMARRWRTGAERSAEERAGKAEAALAQLHRDTVRTVTAWKSARERARKKEAARVMAMSRMEHATQQAARQAVELEDAKRDRATLAQWEATYGPHALRETRARIVAAETGVRRVRALRAQAEHLEPFVAGPTWEMLWEALGEAVSDPIRTIAAVRCVPGTAGDGHPVHALLRALKEDKRPEEAMRLVRDFYDAIHGACCPLDHRDPRPGRAAEAVRRLLDNQIRQASLYPLAVGR